MPNVSVGGDDHLDGVSEVGAYASHARGGPGAEKLDFVEQTIQVLQVGQEQLGRHVGQDDLMQLWLLVDSHRAPQSSSNHTLFVPVSSLTA